MTFTLGNKFKITVFGESHGKCVGVVVDGCPPGQEINTTIIQEELDRRKPGHDNLTSQRKESDRVEILSGILNEKSTGAPIMMLVRNEDVDSIAYEEIKNKPRPGHADLTARIKYNGCNDHRGGGVFSGRMTAAFVMSGAIAKQILATLNIKIMAHIIQIGNVKGADLNENMKREIINAKEDGDSIGGLIECTITGVSAGIGEPMFDSIESVISHAIFSIPAVKGIEFGSGFKCVSMKGSEHNDPIILKNGKIATETNNAGGILGGITNGMPIIFRVAIKPTPSIMKLQHTVDLEKMEECEIKINGRHDPCIAIRAISVVESMAAISLVDLMLRRLLI